MSYANRKNTWKDELWNVSLLPAVKVRATAEPPSGPLDGSTALARPALLSLSEAPAELRQAA
jgi:hypothetical protein